MPELLCTKLMPPSIEPGMIDRPRLLALLSGVASERATLLAAPAGYGKTVLMAQLAADLAEPAQHQGEQKQVHDAPVPVHRVPSLDSWVPTQY